LSEALRALTAAIAHGRPAAPREMRSEQHHSEAGVAERSIRVTHVFEPSRPIVPAGVRVCLTFRREAWSPTSSAVVFPSLGRMVTLRVGCDVMLDLGTLEPGEYPFESWGGGTSGTLVVARARS
jgi:plastocyanin domain-containing protein